MRRKSKTVTLDVRKLRRRKGLCARCGVGEAHYREVGADGRFVRGTMICARCSRLDDKARESAAEVYRQAHPAASLSLWCARLDIYGSDYEPEDLPGPANNNGSHFVCSS